MHAHACRLVHTILLGTARQPVYYFYSISTQLLLAAPAAPMVDFPLTTLTIYPASAVLQTLEQIRQENIIRSVVATIHFHC